MKCIITLTIIFFKKNIVFRCYPSLQAAVDDARTNDVVLIPSGIHSLLNINALRQGGTLMGMNLYSISVNCRLKWFIFSGVGSREDVVIHLGSSTEVGLLFEGGQVTLKNLTILVNNKQSGISVKVLIFFHFNYFRSTVMFLVTGALGFGTLCHSRSTVNGRLV